MLPCSHRFTTAATCCEDGRIYASPEAWAKLLREMRDVLARCMILGRMEVATDSFVLDTDEEDYKSIEEAEKLLGEEFFDITPEVALAALQARAENEEKIMAGLKKIMTFMGEEGLRRGLNKEERGKITLREAFSPDEDEEEEGED
jgi:hypothetical protein